MAESDAVSFLYVDASGNGGKTTGHVDPGIADSAIASGMLGPLQAMTHMSLYKWNRTVSFTVESPPSPAALDADHPYADDVFDLVTVWDTTNPDVQVKLSIACPKFPPGGLVNDGFIDVTDTGFNALKSAVEALVTSRAGEAVIALAEGKIVKRRKKSA